MKNFRDAFENTGFINIVKGSCVVPIGLWPKNHSMKFIEECALLAAYEDIIAWNRTLKKMRLARYHNRNAQICRAEKSDGIELASKKQIA
jgi:hypothetical protein